MKLIWYHWNWSHKSFSIWTHRISLSLRSSSPSSLFWFFLSDNESTILVILLSLNFVCVIHRVFFFDWLKFASSLFLEKNFFNQNWFSLCLISRFRRLVSVRFVLLKSLLSSCFLLANFCIQKCFLSCLYHPLFFLLSILFSQRNTFGINFLLHEIQNLTILFSSNLFPMQ